MGTMKEGPRWWMEEAVEEIMKAELDFQILMSEDSTVTNAMRVVRAYYSVPGTYLEGAYD
jgi:hypothetical protein